MFFSPDGNEDPDDIVRLDDLLLQGADLAIASRFAKGAVNEETDILRPRARINQMLSHIANTCFNRSTNVTDTINGFRALRRKDLLDLETTVKRFPIEYQISIQAMQREWSIQEIPTIEGQRSGGESKAISWPVGKDHVRVLLTELYRSRFWFYKLHTTVQFSPNMYLSQQSLECQNKKNTKISRSYPCPVFRLDVSISSC